MSEPLGIGQAFGNYVETRRRQRDLYDAASGAAEMFRQIGTPEAQKFADMFLQNPRGAFAMGESVGGLKNLLAMSQEQAARARLVQAGAVGEPGSPEQLRSIGTTLLPDNPGSAVNALVASRPTAQSSPFGKVDPSDFTPASLAKFEQTGNLSDLVRQYAPKQSEEFTLGPDGVTYRRGGSAAGTTATQTNIEKQLSDARGLQQRLAGVRNAYQPQFQTLPFRAAQTLSSWGEKLGRDPTPEEKQALGQFSEFRGISVDMVSQYLHQLSGAAITPQEYKRLTESLPNAGYGLFDGDGPTVFESKLKATERQGKLAMLRLDHERKNGLGLGESGFSLFDRKGILKATAEDIEKQLVSGGMPSDRARAVAAQRIAEINASLEQ
jgi:hypothetical protein